MVAMRSALLVLLLMRQVKVAAAMALAGHAVMQEQEHQAPVIYAARLGLSLDGGVK